jgi:prepilin-type N-terminal cleavage/methylation domain-containing protein
MNKKNNRKGFTIVELVIVIAVIAILATVLIPTFGNIIDKANASKLLQNIRNEYTEYTIEEAGKDDFASKIYVQIGTNYYEVDNGNVTLDETTKAPKEFVKPTAEGAVIWTGTAVEKVTANAGN